MPKTGAPQVGEHAITCPSCKALVKKELLEEHQRWHERTGTNNIGGKTWKSKKS